MLWDSSFASWQQLGITGQPAGALLTSGGQVMAQWSGGIPEEEVLTEAAKLP